VHPVTGFQVVSVHSMEEEVAIVGIIQQCAIAQRGRGREIT
jgi:hypothetical protein